MIGQWQKWRSDVVADDTFSTNYAPAEYAALTASKVVSVKPWSMVAVRAWGKAAASKTATVRISGWMAYNATRGDSHAGPGQVLWTGVCTTGAITFTERPIKDQNFTETAWFEVSDWSAVASGDFNACNARQIREGGQCMLLIPTCGYCELLLEVKDLAGAGEMTAFGAAWHPMEPEAWMVADSLLVPIQGQAAIAVAGTAVPLSATSQIVETVGVCAYPLNTTDIYVGGSGVVATAGSETGHILAPGDPVGLPGPVDLSSVYVNGLSVADYVTYSAMKKA